MKLAEDVATSFQNSVVEVLTHKAIHACKTYHVNRLIVAGGVANKGLRAALSEACKKKAYTLLFQFLFFALIMQR